jgi:hypothetical protein
MFLLKNKRSIYLFFLPLLFSSCLGEAELSDRVLEEANTMGDALLKKDYEKCADYLIDWAAMYMGGKKLAPQSIKKIVTDYEARGRKFISVHFEMISQVMEKDNVYQCLLSQTTTVSNPYGNTTEDAIIYAISEDAENWKFATITYMPKAKLKELSPYLHPDLKNPNWVK